MVGDPGAAPCSPGEGGRAGEDCAAAPPQNTDLDLGGGAQPTPPNLDPHPPGANLLRRREPPPDLNAVTFCHAGERKSPRVTWEGPASTLETPLEARRRRLRLVFLVGTLVRQGLEAGSARRPALGQGGTRGGRTREGRRRPSGEGRLCVAAAGERGRGNGHFARQNPTLYFKSCLLF
jgi:hypothetical protein